LNIDIRQAALVQLRSTPIGEGKGVRINVQEVYQGGCGCERVVSLVQSKTDPKDGVVCAYGVTLLMDDFAQQILGDHLILNYAPLVGFTLATTEQTIAYGLHVKG